MLNFSLSQICLCFDISTNFLTISIDTLFLFPKLPFATSFEFKKIQLKNFVKKRSKENKNT